MLENVGEQFEKYYDCLLLLPETLMTLKLWVFMLNRIREPMRSLPFINYTTKFDDALSKLRHSLVLQLYFFRMTHREVDAIESMEHIKELHIYTRNYRCNRMTGLTKLVRLYLFYFSINGEDWFGNLAANCKNLEKLELMGCSVPGAGISRLGELRNLEYLTLDSVISPINGQGFANFEYLTVFICSGDSHINDSCIMKLLQVATKLKVLWLCKSCGTTWRIVEFANRITKERTLKLLLRVDLKHFHAWVTRMRRLDQESISPRLRLITDDFSQLDWNK